MNKLTIRKIKGEYEFFWGKRNITLLWLDFFSGLHMEQEKDCVKLFIKKYAKKVNSNPPPTNNNL